VNGTAAVKAVRTKVEKPPVLTPKEATGFKYADKHGEYDVPIIDEPMWYRVTVRKGIEKRMCDMLEEAKGEAPWRGVLFDTFYPQAGYVRLKGKSLVVVGKPLLAGLVYVKTRMNPDVADDIESIPGVYGLSMSQPHSFVTPLGAAQTQQLESMRNKTLFDLSPEQKLIKKDGYVSIVSGTYEGSVSLLSSMYRLSFPNMQAVRHRNGHQERQARGVSALRVQRQLPAVRPQPGAALGTAAREELEDHDRQGGGGVAHGQGINGSPSACGLI
jgi:transcription antitermination factor NusG